MANGPSANVLEAMAYSTEHTHPTVRLRCRGLFVAALGIQIFVGTLYPQQTRGQQTNQSRRPDSVFARAHFDQTTVNRGREDFLSNCSFCHGHDARGTGRAPDLARSLVILRDVKGQQLGHFLQTGRPGLGMPAFPTLTGRQIKDIATFLHFQVRAARSRGKPLNILVGNAKAGEAYFNGAGKCSTCHSVTGDLKGIGSKYDPVLLQDKIVNPRYAGQPYDAPLDHYPYSRNVTVCLRSGHTVSGTLLYLSEFAVTLRNSAGERHTYKRDGRFPKVELIDPLQAHQDMLTKYTDVEIHDLTAYLAAQK